MRTLRAIGLSTAFAVAVLAFSPTALAQRKERGGWGEWGYDAPRDRQWNYCPQCGRPWGPYGGYGMDPRGRQGREHRMEPMPDERGYVPGREPGYDYGPYHPGYENPPYQWERRRPLDESRARRMMQGYLDYTENPNLKLGDVRETEGFFEGEIVTKKESALVDKVRVDKKTGRMRFGN